MGRDIARRSDRRDLPYPRRVVLRYLLRKAAAIAFWIVGRLEVRGIENLPQSGPVILAANHFHFADPVAFAHLSRRQVEFVGGFRFPNAPMIVKFLPSLWGYLPVHRGGYSRASLDYALQILAKGGVVGIFPEGGSWAQVLRPARPGIGYLAAESGAQVVPIAIRGFPKLFRKWRPALTVTVGKPVGPFQASHGPGRREEIRAIGASVMGEIAAMLPDEERGVFAKDAWRREQAAADAEYPFDQEHMRGM